MSGTLCCKFLSEFGLKIWWMIYQYTIFYWLLFFLSLALLKVFSHHTNSPDWFSMQFPFREHFIDTKVLTYILIILFSWLCLRTRGEILSWSLMRLNVLGSIDTGRGQTEVNCWSSWSLLPETKINQQIVSITTEQHLLFQFIHTVAGISSLAVSEASYPTPATPSSLVVNPGHNNPCPKQVGCLFNLSFISTFRSVSAITTPGTALLLSLVSTVLVRYFVKFYHSSISSSPG